jgi:hypothetical protein
VQQKNLENVFHLENDVMLYVNLGDLLPIFETYYPGMGATFDNEERCIPGFIYIQKKEALNPLAKTFRNYASTGLNDMTILSLFQKAAPQLIDFLPVTTEEYANAHSMVSLYGQTTSDKTKFSQHIEQFNSIFDAAAIGQYLGGDNSHLPPGFINERALYNPSAFSYTFIPDEQGRIVPYASYKGVSYRVNTLHIHCKDLKSFSSLNFALSSF